MPDALIMALLLSLFCFPPGLPAQTSEELFEMPLDDLLNLDISVATKTKIAVEDAPSIVSVITGDEIRNMGARNLMDVLRTVPGFDFNHVIIVPQHEPYVRGMSGGLEYEKLKILINGMPMIKVGYMSPHIPVSNIRRIEIIRGPGSALYGTGAFAGLIDIITRKGGEEPSSVGFEMGSHGTIKPYGEFSYKDEDFSAYMFASFYKTEGDDGVIESDMASDSPVLASAAPGEMSADARATSVQTHVTYRDFFFSGQMIRLDSNNPVGVAKALGDEDEVEDVLASYELGYRMPVSKGSFLFRLFHSRSSADRTWEIFPEETAEMEMHTGFPPGEGLIGNPLFKQRDVGGEVTADFRPLAGWEFVAGASYLHKKIYDVRSFSNHNVTGHPVEIDGITYPAFPYAYFHTGFTDLSDIANWLDEGERDVVAAYLQSVFDLKDILSLEKGVKGLSLTLGGRYDHYSDFGGTFNPRVGLVYAPLGNLWFKALYGTAFRAPVWGEMYQKNNPSQSGNPDLEAETIETREFLVGFRFARHFSGTLNYYETRIDDIISVVGGEFDNYGTMEGKGVEAEVRFRFAKNRYAYCNLTWQDVRNTTGKTIQSEGGLSHVQADYNPGGIPEFMGNLGLNWEIGRYVNANLSLNYVGEKDRSEEKIWDSENLVAKDSRDPVDARTLVNASLIFRNFCQGLEIQISGFNLFDEDHRSPDPDGALYHDMPESGRWFTGRISYSF